MTDFLNGRDHIINALRSELLGPYKGDAKPLKITSEEIHFPDRTAALGPWMNSEDQEEILIGDSPTKRYGIGVLYPVGVSNTFETPTEPDITPINDDPLEQSNIASRLKIYKDPEFKNNSGENMVDDDDFDITTTSGYRPSSMGVSFLYGGKDINIDVSISGGKYQPQKVTIGTKNSTWWVRKPVILTRTFNRQNENWEIQENAESRNTIQTHGIEIALVTRPWKNTATLVTVFLANRTQETSRAIGARCIFQCHIRIEDYNKNILPYPDNDHELVYENPEDKSFQLLYRTAQTYAVGHGCAANWEKDQTDENAHSIIGEALPLYETPNITPDILNSEGQKIQIPMSSLAGLEAERDGMDSLETMLNEYRKWIEQRRNELATLTAKYTDTGKKHLTECEISADRIEAGINFIKNDPIAQRAFQLANEAMLIQQMNFRATPREVEIVNERYSFQEPIQQSDWRSTRKRGNWRPFQIAFLLASIPSVANNQHSERELVELIWFPTGGGKTEAYLGLSAFSAFYRRLRDLRDVGTDVIMRYTLRLLTTQQFVRAASLICAMEHLRRREETKLGSESFSIGVWLGSATTPNKRGTAKSVLRKLKQGDKYQDNQFLLLRCPWCSAQMGPIKAKNKSTKIKVAGYEEATGTVKFRCPDNHCEFSEDGLPIFVIDEDVYENKPTIIIGTVDKFAQLAWQPDARSIFGLDASGNRCASPPSLIIQDELHLISGPLGSVVGLYESLIEDLCTWNNKQSKTKPKIIGSTATIRRFEQQVKALYNRNHVALFPPRGLDSSDSFFARYDRDEEGNLTPGRIYIGVHGASLGSVQTAQVRTISTLLQAPMELNKDERDPWWTLLTFFNSLRELGTSLSLVQSDIPDYLRVMRIRSGTRIDPRRIRIYKELTGRLRPDEIPKAIDELAKSATNSEAIDICLASNIIEVGIDIERLSLICVVGQPKTTSQYIQVTGRVGRQWKERPGLVVTILSPSKPRDRSHFEHFRSYHEKLYAQVEPTSVTPFAPPVLERALHAVISGYVRQYAPRAIEPWPFPKKYADEAIDIITKRADGVDANEIQRLNKTIKKRIREWTQWERTEWSSSGYSSDGKMPLLRRAGEWAPPEVERVTWSTPTSMRNVDAECLLNITNIYAAERAHLND